LDKKLETEIQGPALNYCPQCGTLLEDKFAFGQIRRYCSACDRIVFHEHKVAAAVLVMDGDNRVLLVRRAMNPQRGLWSLPAGFVDYGESPEEAACRECLEETGFRTEIEEIIEIVSGREHPRGADIVIIYRGRITGGVLQAADDADDAAFFTPERLPALAFEATRKALATWMPQHNDSAEELPT
jgi:8-oxo-dGTP diphosphatase